MESDLAVEMLNTKKDDTFQVPNLIGDDDSTTMAMVGQQVNHQVEKWSDVNHAKKSLGTVALSLSNGHSRAHRRKETKSVENHVEPRG